MTEYDTYYLNMTLITYVVCIHVWESICGLQSQLFSKNERLFKVMGSHIGLHCESGIISSIVQDRHIVLHTTNRKCDMAYQFVSFTVTLKVILMLQGFSNAIRGTFVQHFARFQLTQCTVQSLSDT